MKQEHINEIKAIIILALGMILLASFISFVPEDLPWYTSVPNSPTQNLIRITGAYIAGVMFFVFGYSAYALVVLLFFWSWNKFLSREIVFNWYKLISFIVLLCVLSSLFSMNGSQISSDRFQRAGLIGFFISDFLVEYIGWMGSYIILITLGVLAFILSGEFLLTPFFAKVIDLVISYKGNFLENISALKQKVPNIKPKINLGNVLKSKLKSQEVEEDDEYEYEYEYVDAPKKPIIKLTK